MLRFIATLLLTGTLLGFGMSPASAQPPYRMGQGWRGPEIAGGYVNQSNGARCYVERRDRSYIFVNESGSRARFIFTGPDRLEQVAGDWDRSVIATVQRDRLGRILLRFDSPNAPPGYWAAY
jgi:hypothetical protein